MIATRVAAAAIAGLAAGLASAASAQTGADRSAPPPVALEQLSTPSPRTDASDLDVAATTTLSRSAAVASPEISTRADGRVVATAPVEGDDRCDPARGAPRTEACRQRLETRAGDYRRPEAASVTAEGRLLLLVSPNTSASTSRPLAGTTGLTAPDGPAGQLAEALREQATQDASASAAAAAAKQNALPAGVPPIVVLPGR